LFFPFFVRHEVLLETRSVQIPTRI
jgi:hypothetical protein